MRVLSAAGDPPCLETLLGIGRAAAARPGLGLRHGSPALGTVSAGRPPEGAGGDSARCAGSRSRVTRWRGDRAAASLGLGSALPARKPFWMTVPRSRENGLVRWLRGGGSDLAGRKRAPVTVVQRLLYLIGLPPREKSFSVPPFLPPLISTFSKLPPSHMNSPLRAWNFVNKFFPLGHVPKKTHLALVLKGALPPQCRPPTPPGPGPGTTGALVRCPCPALVTRVTPFSFQRRAKRRLMARSLALPKNLQKELRPRVG